MIGKYSIWTNLVFQTILLTKNLVGLDKKIVKDLAISKKKTTTKKRTEVAIHHGSSKLTLK